METETSTKQPQTVGDSRRKRGARRSVTIGDDPSKTAILATERGPLPEAVLDVNRVYADCSQNCPEDVSIARAPEQRSGRNSAVAQCSGVWEKSTPYSNASERTPRRRVRSSTASCGFSVEKRQPRPDRQIRSTCSDATQQASRSVQKTRQEVDP